jgi:3-methyladenine DNA glycosylase AlkD
MEYKEVISKLKSMYNQENVDGMKKFGINPSTAFGITVPDLRKLSKQIGKNHRLALELWHSRIHEARILATMIDEVEKVDGKQVESWINDFDSWDLCDQACFNLFRYSSFAFDKAKELSSRKEEFVKRAGFAIMAGLAVGDKASKDDKFWPFLKIIAAEAQDERNFVKKAVNWALRQIGKRSRRLNQMAIKTAEEIEKLDNKTAKWIAKDALKELKDPKILARL